MSASRYSSRVFVAGAALFDRLNDLSFPEHPATGRQPTVEFSAENPTEGHEKIVIRLNDNDTDISWQSLSPPRREEELRIDVLFASYVPLRGSSRGVWDRLGAVSDVIQTAVFTTSPVAVRPLNFDGERDVGQVVRVEPAVWPAGDGWVGECLHTFRLVADI